MPESKRIAHVSDVHFGKIATPSVVDALVEDVHAADVDVVAVSGDLTQRALPGQYAAARDFLARFTPPVIVVPGNHDVYAWWRPAGRLMDPLRRYRRYVTDDLTPSIRQDGLSIFGLNSATGWTVKGGHVRPMDRLRMTQFFESSPPNDFRVLVIHHHLTRVRALGPHDVARNAEETLEAAVGSGVDLILCGHLHISHIEPVEIVPAAHRLVIASAGTATSSRGRRQHRKSNFYNVVTVESESFRLEERLFDPDSGAFRTEFETSFDRSPAPTGA
jgi:3',5'-cyclic AMP phosphodiesterase CpdA